MGWHGRTGRRQGIEREYARRVPDAEATRDSGLRVASLLHEIGKPATRRFERGGETFHHHDVVGSKLAKQRLRVNAKVKRFAPDAMNVMSRYEWPGNVRVLENGIERSVVLDRDGIVGSDDLPRELTQCGTQFADSVTIPLGTPLEEVERILMEETLKRTRGDKGLASKLLGISTRTLYRKMDRKEE